MAGFSLAINGFSDQRLWVDIEFGQLLVTHNGPTSDNFWSDLWMELGADALAAAKNLGRDLGPGNLNGTVRDRESVVMPFKPRSWRDDLWLVRLDFVPADLWSIRLSYPTSQGSSQYLTPEAQAEDGCARSVCASN